MPYLVLLNADRSTTRLEITKVETTLGSRRDNDLVVAFSDVSRHHAKVRRGENGTRLTDLGSTNQVFVDGNPIDNVILTDKTVFTLGRDAHVLYLETPDEEAEASFVERHLPRSTRRIVAPVTDSAAGAAARTIEELESLIEVGARVNSSLDLDEVLDTVLERALALTGADRGIVMLLEDGVLTPSVTRNMDPAALEGDRLSFSRSFATRVLTGKQALAAPDMDSLPQFSSQSIIAHNIRSIMCAPLTIKDEAFGCLYVDLKRAAQHISEANLSFFTALANQAAIAIHNARMTDSLRRNQASLEEANTRLEQSLHQLEFLYDLSRSINRGHDIAPVLEQCLSRTRRLMETELATLTLEGSNPEGFTTRMVLRSPGPKPDAATLAALEAVSQRVATSRQPLLCRADDRPASIEKLLQPAPTIRQVVSAPLTSTDRCLGSITLANPRREGGFASKDLELLTSVANLVALSIEKHRAYQQRIVQEKLNQEIENARKVQQLLLPKKLPELPGFEFSSKIALPNRVGGDTFDFVPLPDDRLAIVLADVAGHDIGAAIVLAMARSLVRSFLTADHSHALSPATVLSRMNDILIEDTGGQRFVTLFLGILDARAATLTYSNAGNPNPLWSRGVASGIETLTAGGIPLGLFPSPNYVEDTIAVGPGTLAVFFTDGLVEARAASDELFGVERVQALLTRHRDDSCADLVAAIYDSALRFTGEVALQDDFTLVAMRSA